MLKINNALLILRLSDGRTISIWPDNPIAEHIMISIQQADRVERLRLSEVSSGHQVNKNNNKV